MQELFPREGETVPRLRFPEFRDAGEWEEKSLSELGRVTNGGTPNTSDPTFWDGVVQWATPAEIGKGFDKYILSTIRTLTAEGLESCSSELLPENSVIISTRAPIGLLAINKTQMAINQGCHGIIPNENADSHFLFYSLELAKKKLNDIGAGNTFKELSGKALKGFSLLMPLLKEQQKIAACLSSLDDLITAQARKVEALKTHKKGLMQQLFPVPDTMTG